MLTRALFLGTGVYVACVGALLFFVQSVTLHASPATGSTIIHWLTTDAAGQGRIRGAIRAEQFHPAHQPKPAHRANRGSAQAGQRFLERGGCFRDQRRRFRAEMFPNRRQRHRAAVTEPAARRADDRLAAFYSEIHEALPTKNVVPAKAGTFGL